MVKEREGHKETEEYLSGKTKALGKVLKCEAKFFNSFQGIP